MNRVFKTLWSHAHQQYVVTNEHHARRGKVAKSAVALAVAGVMAVGTAMAADAVEDDAAQEQAPVITATANGWNLQELTLTDVKAIKDKEEAVTAYQWDKTDAGTILVTGLGEELNAALTGNEKPAEEEQAPAEEENNAENQPEAKVLAAENEAEGEQAGEGAEEGAGEGEAEQGGAEEGGDHEAGEGEAEQGGAEEGGDHEAGEGEAEQGGDAEQGEGDDVVAQNPDFNVSVSNGTLYALGNGLDEATINVENGHFGITNEYYVEKAEEEQDKPAADEKKAAAEEPAESMFEKVAAETNADHANVILRKNGTLDVFASQDVTVEGLSIEDGAHVALVSANPEDDLAVMALKGEEVKGTLNVTDGIKAFEEAAKAAEDENADQEQQAKKIVLNTTDDIFVKTTIAGMAEDGTIAEGLDKLEVSMQGKDAEDVAKTIAALAANDNEAKLMAAISDAVFADAALKPEEGGEVNPDEGGEANPDEGGEVNPDEGGEVNPDEGGEAVEPGEGGEEVQPEEGGEEVQPEEGGEEADQEGDKNEAAKMMRAAPAADGAAAPAASSGAAAAWAGLTADEVVSYASAVDVLANTQTAAIINADALSTAVVNVANGFGSARTAKIDGMNFWMTGIGSHSEIDSDYSDLKTNFGMALMGIDTAVNADTRLGGFLGAGHTTSKAGDFGKFTSTDLMAGIYAHAQMADVVGLTGGLSYMHQDRDFKHNGKVGADGDVVQIFGEAAYTGLNTTDFTAEPYLGLAWMRLSSDDFTQTAAMTGFKTEKLEAKSQNLGVTTLGVRAAVPFKVSTFDMKAKADASWKHFLGDNKAKVDVTLPGVAVQLEGDKLKDLGAVELGIDAALSKSATLGLSYMGAYGSHVTSHGANLTFTYSF